jgi:hypothetical protein
MSLTAAAQAGTPLAPLPASYVESFKATLQAEGGDKSLQVRTTKLSFNPTSVAETYEHYCTQSDSLWFMFPLSLYIEHCV